MEGSEGENIRFSWSQEVNNEITSLAQVEKKSKLEIRDGVNYPGIKDDGYEECLTDGGEGVETQVDKFPTENEKLGRVTWLRIGKSATGADVIKLD